MGVEIDDLLAAEDLDVEEIMRRIRAYISERGGVVEPVELAAVPRPCGQLGRSLAADMAEASYAARNVAVTMNVTRTPLPVIGPLLDGLRARAHQLVIFYVNQMATRQMAFNTQVMRVLTALVEELDGGAGADLEPLQRELRDLRELCNSSLAHVRTRAGK